MHTLFAPQPGPAGSPGELRRNFRSYVAGIHARMDLVRQNRTSQTLSSLVEISRRLTAPDFVAFLLLYDDLHSQILYRHGQLMQASGVEIWTLERHTLKAIRLLSENSIANLRFWVFFTALRRNYVTQKDLKSLWSALLLSNLGRTWPRFVGAIFHLFLGSKPKFQDCFLQLPVDFQSGQRLMSPHCQCGSRKNRREEMISRTAQVAMKVGQRKRRLRVPLWVARSQHHKDDWTQEINKLKEENTKAIKRGSDLNCTSIKYRIRTWIRKTDAPAPVGLQGVCGLFSARCHFSLWFSYVYDCIDKSLGEIEKLHAALEREYKEYWGDVGVSQHVRFLKQLMLKSFNFEAFFSYGGPDEEARQAFRDLVEQLAPVLSQTVWPDPTTHPYVQRVWPSTDQLIEQYDCLIASLCYHSKQEPFKYLWYPVKGYEAGALCFSKGSKVKSVQYIRFMKYYLGIRRMKALTRSSHWSFQGPLIWLCATCSNEPVHQNVNGRFVAP